MKNFLNSIRKPSDTSDTKTSKKITNSLLILILGIMLGMFSKWLDNVGIDDTIWWQHILGILDLRNVFSGFGIWILFGVLISVYSKTPLRASLNVFLFFLGMTTSYHLYTIIFSGFNPKQYMMIWYVITFVTPLFAFICWYAKGDSIVSIIISSIIIAIMLSVSFSIGFWYFDFNSVIDTLLFLGTIIALYVKPQNTIYSILAGIILAYSLGIIIYI